MKIKLRYVVAVILGLLFALAYVETAAAQGNKVDATIEGTTGGVVETSFRQPGPEFVLMGRRWKPATKVLQVEGNPIPDLRIVARVDLGTIDNPPLTVDPRNNRGSLSHYPEVEEYVGTSHQWEIGGGYRLARHLSINANYFRYSLKDDVVLFEPYSFDGSGLLIPYVETNSWQGLGFGPSSDLRVNDKLVLEGDFLWYPKVGRHFKSYQKYLLQEFRNDNDVDGRTAGINLDGRIKYSLARHLNVLFSYRFQRFATDWGKNAAFIGGQRQYLKIVTPSFGINVGF